MYRATFLVEPAAAKDRSDGAPKDAPEQRFGTEIEDNSMQKMRAPHFRNNSLRNW